MLTIATMHDPPAAVIIVRAAPCRRKRRVSASCARSRSYSFGINATEGPDLDVARFNVAAPKAEKKTRARRIQQPVFPGVPEIVG